MSNVVIYNPTDITVANRVTSYLLSVNTPDYEGNPNTLINPDISSLVEIDSKYWKVSDDNIIEMTANEKIAIDNFLTKKKYKILTYSTLNNLSKETWYNTDNGDGTYKDKFEESTYTYSNNNLLNKVVKGYFADGTEASSVTYAYYKNDQNQIIEKKVG